MLTIYAEDEEKEEGFLLTKAPVLCLGVCIGNFFLEKLWNIKAFVDPLQIWLFEMEFKN